ncbi:hypothetical protein [Nocardioides dongkuii]|uniref:hypothetical protein n=1 Tax=Nocardioides dongkuii TaxID=2760089 RepID=UPI0015FCD0FB|nr:hypothetical protein [Nocardioides dongkuii]
MRKYAQPLAVVALTAGLVTGGAGWYAAAHPEGHQHFDSCAVQPDDTLVLRYGHGVGDKVTASAQATKTAIVVSLHVQREPGLSPAVLLHGELQFNPDGLDGKPVVDVDGTVLPCPPES